MNLSNNHSEPVSNRAGTCASSDEVRDFLQKIKCKDPEKVLGVEATRGLTTALIQSTVLTVLVLVGFTILPYVRGKLSAATKPETKPVEKEVKAETPEPTKTTPAAPVKTTPDKTATEKGKTTPASDKGFLEKIGATETKPASPKVNPLEKTTDDLFKDIDKK